MQGMEVGKAWAQSCIYAQGNENSLWLWGKEFSELYSYSAWNLPSVHSHTCRSCHESQQEKINCLVFQKKGKNLLYIDNFPHSVPLIGGKSKKSPPRGSKLGLFYASMKSDDRCNPVYTGLLHLFMPSAFRLASQRDSFKSTRLLQVPYFVFFSPLALAHSPVLFLFLLLV